MADGYSLKEYFGGRTPAYYAYKEGQKSGKWADLPSYIAQGGTGGASGSGTAKQDLFDKFKLEDEAFLERYRTAIPTIWDRLSTEHGLPELRNVAQQLTETVEDIPQQVSTTGQQVGMSANRQAQRVQAELGKYTPMAQRAVQQAQFATDTVNQLFQNELMPFATEIGQLASRHAMEFTGYRDEIASSLNVILQQLATGEAISLQQMQDAANMARLEKQYELALKNNLAYYEATRKDGTAGYPTITSVLGGDQTQPTYDPAFDQEEANFQYLGEGQQVYPGWESNTLGQPYQPTGTNTWNPTYPGTITSGGNP